MSANELRVAHALALAMQEAASVGDLQELLLDLITGELGYERALLAMADGDGALSGWLCSTGGPGAHLQRIPYAERVPLDAPGWLLSSAMASGRPELVADGAPPTGDPRLNELFALRRYALLPMVLRSRPLGLLLVDNPLSGRPLGPADLELLSHVAAQAAVVLGGLRLMLDRAQRLAAEGERARIAMEFHDSLAQQLYGISYTIDACLRLLPGRPEQAAEQLRYLQSQSRRSLVALRRAVFDLWPHALDAERYEAELRAYLAEIAPAHAPRLFIQVDRAYDRLPEPWQRQLYRIAQEALTNVVRHAGARRAKVTLLVRPGELALRVADDGCGFDPRAAAGGRDDGSGFGLLSMRERAEALGGALRLDSAPGQGTAVTVTAPLRAPGGAP